MSFIKKDFKKFYHLISNSISMEKNKILDNKFISDISMEIYLSHMVIFRLKEKLHITKSYLQIIMLRILLHLSSF